MKQINDIALLVTGVTQCSNIRTRKMGHYSIIDLTIHVDPKIVSTKKIIVLTFFLRAFPLVTKFLQKCNIRYKKQFQEFQRF
jgi:hypothetical protein